MTRAQTEGLVKPELTAVQLAPLLVEKKTPPPSVPAKRCVPLAARAKTAVAVKPELASVQLVPFIVERKTPPPSVPARRLVPETAKDQTFPSLSPLVEIHWACKEGEVEYREKNTTRDALNESILPPCIPKCCMPFESTLAIYTTASCCEFKNVHSALRGNSKCPRADSNCRPAV